MSMDGDVEICNPDLPRGQFRSVLFDFDGTLSLIREGWPDVMIPMMVEILQETGTPESQAELTAVVRAYVDRLTGHQTIVQMFQLAEEVRQRGRPPCEPLVYKRRYHDLLAERIEGRLAALASGKTTADDWTVPGTHALLTDLRRRGLVLYLASGTDLEFVRQEVELLGLAPFFGANVYGALDDHRRFSKQMVVEQILEEHGLRGEELLGFGDGFVEIEEVKRVGGVAIAVASDEARRQGVDAAKRQRLLEAGADVVIPDYRCRERLLHYLFPDRRANA